jgi:two-component system nitrate/nitrite response regulator NarL
MAPLKEILTARQYEIASMVRDGHSNKVIGELLGITDSTVKHYLMEVFKRLRCDSRVTLAIKFERENPKK